MILTAIESARMAIYAAVWINAVTRAEARLRNGAQCCRGSGQAFAPHASRGGHG